jgi:hypothetical protein
MIQNLKTNITYYEYIRIKSNNILNYSFSSCKLNDTTCNTIPYDLLKNIHNYEVVDNKATYLIMK